MVIIDKDTGEEKKRAIEDLGFVILDNPQITFTQSAIQDLAANNTAVVFCNEKHLPSSLLFHLDTNQIQNEHFRSQIKASQPLKKFLWQQTVKAKIKNQASLLDFIEEDGEALRYLSRQVKSGDSDNQEAQAARYYWGNLFDLDFRRQRFGLPPNSHLNYGYAILRAAVARALSGSGLLPTLGIHHHNKYNAYCLADDIMEPYRPYVDQHVWELWEAGLVEDELNTKVKASLLNVLTCDISIGKKKRPLMNGISETTASLARCFRGEVKSISFPVF